MWRAKLHSKAVIAFLCFLPIALQIQVTLFERDTYQGLRFNMADLLLPIAGLYIAASLFFKHSRWPQWNMKGLWLWLAGLLGIMSIALVNGYMSNGYWSSWALINKYIGFIVLLSYFALGGWAATNMPRLNFKKEDVARIFCGFCLIVLCLSFSSTLLQPFTDFPLWYGNFPWAGLMVNRNAFMVLVVFTMVIMEVYRLSGKPVLPAWAYALFWIIMPTFTLFNASRIGWIVGGVFLLGVFVKAPLNSMKKILPYLLIGSLIAYGAYLGCDRIAVKNGRSLRYLVNSMHPDDVTYLGDIARYTALEDGLELYKQSNPAMGAGLGTYQEFQTQKRGEFLDIIDWTALWLLVETGALGLLSFSAFFLALSIAFYKKSSKESDVFARSMLISLVLIAIMSFVHELLYMRFLWLFLGLALAQTLSRTNSAAQPQQGS